MFHTALLALLNCASLLGCCTATLRRFDQFNVRLRLAVFDSRTATRCRLLSLAPSPAGGDRQQPTSITYRGSAVALLQPGGIAPAGKLFRKAMHALAMQADASKHSG